MNKLLFGAIGVLFLAIALLAVADFSIQSSSGTTTMTPTTTETTKSYTMADVAVHNSPTSCYTTISGEVYDLTSFISQHPGGPARIESLCGIDGTSAFTAQHGTSRRPANELASLKIGTLVK
jgi:cytochrome b involved in lipid metabolism